ncbi:hypothetical protein FJTKL_05046 [Diaporthe vaccinii]|uniref:Uncharacterized protein n=1 Tax=Diaporthe vaccinii TaxID=105482 RepID=A0ABR4EZ05_9PEZI
MKGNPEFVILKYSAWLDASQFQDAILGAVVQYPLTPSTDHVPETPLQYNHIDLVEGTLTEFLLVSSNASSNDASAVRGSMAAASFKGRTRDSLQLAGKLRVLDTVPGWISLLNTWPLCLVVGVMTDEEVDLDYSGAVERNVHGKLEVPLATVGMAAAGAPAGVLSGVDGSTAHVEAATSPLCSGPSRPAAASSSSSCAL